MRATQILPGQMYHQAYTCPADDFDKSKGSVSQLMDDLDLINSVEQVEAMVNSIQKGVENVLRK